MEVKDKGQSPKAVFKSDFGHFMSLRFSKRTEWLLTDISNVVHLPLETS